MTAGARYPELPIHAPNAALLIDFDNVTMGIRSDLGKELRSLLSSEIIRRSACRLSAPRSDVVPPLPRTSRRAREWRCPLGWACVVGADCGGTGGAAS